VALYQCIVCVLLCMGTDDGLTAETRIPHMCKLLHVMHIYT